MKILFGTDGIRSEAGVFPLDKKTISHIGNSLANHKRESLGRAPRFVIGRDTRESGLWIEDAFCSGASAAGAECHSAQVITTPGVAFLAKELNFDAGIVISASHNPFQDNGIKIFSPSGKKLDNETEKKIEEDVFAGGKTADGENIQIKICDDSLKFQKLYSDYLFHQFSGLSLNNLKMVIDCANGAASNIAPAIFQKFGAEIVVINDQPDGKNINKDCGSLHIDNLQKEVLRTSADFGVAFDGDADRSLFVDEHGEFVDGDSVLWIMAQHLQNSGDLTHDKIVATVMSNIGLEIALKSRNISLVRTAVGDKYVLKELIESGASIGGEQSGHIIFPKKNLVGDGIYTTLYLLEALVGNQKSLSGMNAGFKKFPQTLVNVKVNKKLPFESVPEIASAAKAVEGELGNKGRLLLRYSGTENLARVMIEGEVQVEIEEQANRLATIIEKRLS